MPPILLGWRHFFYLYPYKLHHYGLPQFYPHHHRRFHRMPPDGLQSRREPSNERYASGDQSIKTSLRDFTALQGIVFMFAMFRATAGRRGRPKRTATIANRCKWRKENEKYPMISKSLGNHGVLWLLATKGTGNPSPTTKKRDSLSTVSLVREAELEGFSWPPTCDPSTNQDRCFLPANRPPTDLM